MSGPVPRRFLRLVDVEGTEQRIVLDHVSRWWPESDALAVVVNGEVVMVAEGATADAALCSAFFEVTPADLGL